MTPTARSASGSDGRQDRAGLGFAYDIKGDSKWKAYGSYSWYFDITKLELPRGSFAATLGLVRLDARHLRLLDDSSAARGIRAARHVHLLDRLAPQFEPGGRDLLELLRPAGDDRDRPEPEAVQTGDFQVGLDHELNPRIALVRATSTSG